MLAGGICTYLFCKDENEALGIITSADSSCFVGTTPNEQELWGY